MFNAKVLADSINPNKQRLTTVELTYPRCIHSEFMTHRMFSRNAASSRAIPVEKMIKQVKDNPFIPIHWGKNQKGMQAWEQLPDDHAFLCEVDWLISRNKAIECVKRMIDRGLHKQIANRLLEPWMWITVICTGNETAYENFFKLRCHKDAEPHIQKLAYLLRDAYDESKPNELEWGEWHLPLINEEDRTQFPEQLREISVGRCARVSYLTHDGKRDPNSDIQLHNRLMESGHWSPFEHVACAIPSKNSSSKRISLGGNLGFGWYQYRKSMIGEVCVKSPRGDK